MSFYDEASWLLIPEGIEEDIVFAQKPTNGLGDLTFTRASDATRTNSAGVIERTPWNLFQSSEMFSNAIWSKVNSTIGVDTALAPNGTQTGDRLFETAISGNHGFFQELNLLTGRSYTLSCYVKRGNRDFCGLQLYFNATSGAIAFFNLATGALVYEFAEGAGYSVTSSSIQNVGGDWFRISAVFTTGLNLTYPGLIVASTQWATGTSYDNPYTGDVTKYIDTWGAQLVEGTDAKPYFATTNRQDVPRLDYRNADGSLNSCPRLLLEPQRTNSIRNSSMVGAVAGSPGTIPTNWSGGGFANLTQTIVGLGTENGLQYIDFRFNGTAVGTTVRIFSETGTQITASNGQTWSSSVYIKRISGTFDSCAIGHALRGTGGTGLGVQTATVSVTTSLARYATTQTVNNASTLSVQPLVDFNVTSGATYDFTIRIAAPQMELGAYATTFIPTTTAAVTRLADLASKTGVSSLIGQTEGTLYAEINISTKTAGSNGNQVIDVSANADTKIFIRRQDGSSLFQVRLRVGGVNVVDRQLINIPAGVAKIAFGYKSGDNNIYVNGVSVLTGAGLTNTFTIVNLLNILDLGHLSGSTNSQIDDRIAQAALFPTRLTNAQLAQLTTL
jgi:hypothetical protein